MEKGCSRLSSDLEIGTSHSLASRLPYNQFHLVLRTRADGRKMLSALFSPKENWCQLFLLPKREPPPFIPLGPSQGDIANYCGKTHILENK